MAAMIASRSSGTICSSAAGLRRNVPTSSSSSRSPAVSDTRACLHAARPASISRCAPPPGGSARSAATRPPATKNARACPVRRPGATMQRSSARRRASRSSSLHTRSSACEPVAEPRRVLVAPRVGELCEPAAQARQRERRPLELVRAAARAPRVARGGASGSARPASFHRRRAHAVAALAQPHVPVGPRDPRVRRRAQLADHAQLLERGLELGAEHAPLDALDRGERRLDRRPLPVGAEVRAQPRAQIARTPDVEQLVVAVVEAVDARPRRRAEREVRACRTRAACASPTSATSSATVRAPRSCASPISASNTSAVACASGSARWHGCTDVPKKYESCASDARGTRPASSAPRERDGVDDGRSEARAGRAAPSRGRETRGRSARCARRAPRRPRSA